MRCLKCSKEISLLRPDNEKEVDFKPETDMWNDGGVHEFIPGYGSRFDSERFIIAICDNCIHEGLVNNLIKYSKNE